MGRKIGVGVIVLAIIACIALLIQSINSGDTDSSVWFKFVLVLASLVVSLVKLLSGTGGGRRSAGFYLKAYENMISGAFANDQKNLVTLGKALRAYNENRYESAIAILEKLKKSCTNTAERRTVGLFEGLCYTDWGLLHKAAEVYSGLIERGEVNFSVYNNLGYVYKNMRKNDEALDAFERALDYGEGTDACIVYVNMASLYLVEGELYAAEDYAKKAIGIEPKLHQAHAMLAIVYAVLDDAEAHERHFRIAVENGENEYDLKMAVKDYTDRFVTEE